MDMVKSDFLVIFDHDGTLVSTETSEFYLFEGIRELLETLEKNGISMAIWTARGRSSTIKSIKDQDISQFFGEFYCAGDGPLKPHPQGPETLTMGFKKENCLHIGDSLSDIEGAKQFGIKAIAACWNSRFQVDIFKEKTPFVAFSPKDCEAIINQHFGIVLSH